MIDKTVEDLMCCRKITKDAGMSIPFVICHDKQAQIAVFSFFANKDSEPMEVYGFDEILSHNGVDVHSQKMDMFKRKKEYIKINSFYVCLQNYRNLEKQYHVALEKLLEHYNDENNNEYVQPVADLFKQIVPVDMYELYRKACPSFLKLLKID